VASIARVLATGVTGSLNELGGYSLAFFLATGIASLAVLAVLPIPEQRRQRHQPSPAQIGRLITRKDVLLPSLLSAVSQYANWAATFGFIPILAQQLGASDTVQSTLVSMSIGIVIVGNSLATAIVHRTGARRLVHASFLLLSIGLGGVGLAKSLISLFLSQSCIGMSLGIVYPVLMGMSIERVADGERNTAMGLHQAVYSVGMFSGPWISGWLADLLGIRPMFGITACFCLAAGLLVNQRMTAND
jgi:predicted MFS family arabinose efflux permease